MRPDVAALNQLYPKYPVTVDDKGWVYGVWYCGTSWQKVVLYGQYPPTFLKRALGLYPNVDYERLLHCPSGSLTGPGWTVDIVSDGVRNPKVVASADHLPFDDNRFDLILSDPPYSVEDSKRYGTGPFPMKRFMEEAWRTLSPGGNLGILDVRYPVYSRKKWRLIALIAVVTGFLRVTRIFSIFEVIK